MGDAHSNQPHPIGDPFTDEMRTKFTYRAENVHIMSLNGKMSRLHRINPRDDKDKFWYTSSMNESTDHLLELYGGYSWQNGLYLASEQYTHTLDTLFTHRRPITVRYGVRLRLDDYFQEILRKIIRSIQYLHAKGIRVGCVSFDNICVFSEDDGSYKLKFKRLYSSPTSNTLHEFDYCQDYNDLALIIEELLNMRNISYRAVEDVDQMLNFMWDDRNLREHCKNLHIHPALLDEKNRCEMRIFAHYEVNVESSVIFSDAYCRWLPFVPPPLYGVLYHPKRVPDQVDTSRGHNYRNKRNSFAAFCRNACMHKDMNIPFVYLDQMLNDIRPGFLSSWFDIISSSTFKLAWHPE